jgi:hypothetical protein
VVVEAPAQPGWGTAQPAGVGAAAAVGCVRQNPVPVGAGFVRWFRVAAAVGGDPEGPTPVGFVLLRTLGGGAAGADPGGPTLEAAVAVGHGPGCRRCLWQQWCAWHPGSRYALQWLAHALS